MKLIIIEILVFILFALSLSNLTISNESLKLSQSKKELTPADNFYNSYNLMTGQPTIKERKLTKNEESDIITFQSINEKAVLFFNISLSLLLITTTLLIIKRNNLLFDKTILSFFILITSWLMIVASYNIFVFWEHQQISSYYNAAMGFWTNDRTYYLFSGAGFSPTEYFSIVWISKNLLTLFCFFLNQNNKDSKNYHLIKRLCVIDLILGNFIILCVHDSFADCYQIIDLRMNRLE